MLRQEHCGAERVALKRSGRLSCFFVKATDDTSCGDLLEMIMLIPVTTETSLSVLQERLGLTFFFPSSQTGVVRMSDAQDAQQAYRRALKEAVDLRTANAMLMAAIQRELLESTDATAGARLEAVLDKARALSTRGVVSPRRRGGTDPSPKGGEEEELPASPREALSPVPVLKPLPVVPMRVFIVPEHEHAVKAVREPTAVTIVRAAQKGTAKIPSLELGQAPTPPARAPARGRGDAPATAEATRLPSPRGLLSVRSGTRGSAVLSLEKQPFVVMHMVLSRLPAESLRVLASCSSVCRALVRAWQAVAKRTNVVLELASTEQKYLNMLCEAILYKEVLLEKKFLDKDQAEAVFSGLPVVIHVGKKLLASVRRKLLDWDDKSCIGDVFLGMMPEFRVFKSYGSAYQASLTHMAKLFQSPGSKQFLESPHFGNLGRLDSLLVAPVQRLPRYVLLLQTCLRATPDAHPDRASLKNALQGLSYVLKLMDASVHSSLYDAMSIVSAIQGVPPNIFENRVLKVVLAGEAVWLYKKHNLIQARLVLFDDFLVVATADASGMSAWKFLLSLHVRNSMLALHRDDGKLEGSSTFFLSLSSVSLNGAILIFSVPSEQMQSQWVSTWKRLSAEQSQRELDESCVEVTNKVAKLMPSGNAAAIASVIRSGSIEKRKSPYSVFKKRYLVLSAAGFTYFTKQNGDKKGFCKVSDIQSAVKSSTGFDILVAGTVYFIRCTDEEASAWVEAFLSLLGGGKRKQSTVQLVFEDGSRALIEVGETELAKAVVERTCAKRKLDATTMDLWTLDGTKVPQTTEGVFLKGRTLRLGTEVPVRTGTALSPRSISAKAIPRSPPSAKKAPNLLTMSSPNLSMHLGESADDSAAFEVISPRKTPGQKLVRVEMPPGSSTKYCTLSMALEATCSDVIAILAQKLKKNPEYDNQEQFLFDSGSNRTLKPSEIVDSQRQQLKLVLSSSTADSNTLVDEIFETDTFEVDSGDAYIGSVTTGTKGLSPLKRTVTNLTRSAK